MNIKIITLLGITLILGTVGFLLNTVNSPSTTYTTPATTATPSGAEEVPVVKGNTEVVPIPPSSTILEPEILSSDERAGLIFMREEEKLARDVYTVLYDTWGLQIFSNIAESERTHTEAVRTLLTKYNIDDPVTDDSIGVFTDSTLVTLYANLTAQGSQSLEDALTVGATIEDLDIRDLQNQIALTDNADIKLVYENLVRGSRNHLHSFVSQLTSRGVAYTPQYITQSEFETIIASPQETGLGKNGRGKGG